MFQVNNSSIGEYLSDLIDLKFSSSRDFCRKWLKLNNEDVNDGTLQNKSDKLSQIKKGKKGIQIYDLPVFSELLGVSFEQILSAGKCDSVHSERMTNFLIAQSKIESEWEDYINLPDKPILCKDEFGFNVIEYAIKFKNYEFIKFLIDKGYIWFDSRKTKDYFRTFGAGTNIQKTVEDCGNGNFIRCPDYDLQCKLATEDKLRMYIISLACDNDDIEMLDKLRVRELPELYNLQYLSSIQPDFNASCNAKIIQHIAKSSKKILEYFTDSFEIDDFMKYKDGSKRKHTFVFPYISQLLDRLVSDNSPFANRALEKMIAYNSSVLEKTDKLVSKVQASRYYYEEYWDYNFDYYKESDIVRFHDEGTTNGIITNIAKVTKKSDDSKTNELEISLNSIYNKIKNPWGKRA